MSNLRRMLALRVVAVVLAALMVFWLLYLSAIYRQASWRSEMLPSPERLAAIASLMDDAPEDARPAILKALATGHFAVRLEAGEHVAERFADLPPQSRYEVADYDEALEGRHFSIERRDLDSRWGNVLGRRYWSFILEFRVALATGETLVIDASNPTLSTAAGLPVGLFAGLVGSVIGLITLVMVIQVSRPLGELAEAVATIDIDGPPREFPEITPFSPELQHLRRAYNALHGRLSHLMKNRMEMIGGISHDVRTFATRLRLKVEGIEDPVERESAVRDIEDMVRMLDDSLMASKAGAGELAEELIDLGELVQSDCEAPARAGAPVELKALPDGGPLNVIADRVALRRILANILDNAVKYGGRAVVTLGRSADFAELVVDDEGPGVRPDEREALFEPFHRLEASRNRKTGGAGLGLAIVRTLVEAQGGTVRLGDSPSGGLRVVVRLPLFKA